MVKRISPLNLGMDLTASDLSELPQQLIGSRSSVSSDNGANLINATASNYTFTVEAGMPLNFNLTLTQQATGTVTVAAGAGVSFVGATLTTAAVGAVISLRRLSTMAETYLVKIS